MVRFVVSQIVVRRVHSPVGGNVKVIVSVAAADDFLLFTPR